MVKHGRIIFFWIQRAVIVNSHLRRRGRMQAPMSRACVRACVRLPKFVRTVGALTYSLVSVLKLQAAGRKEAGRERGLPTRHGAQDATRERRRRGPGWRTSHNLAAWQPRATAELCLLHTTQFVKPTLNGNNVPPSLSFSLPFPVPLLRKQKFSRSRRPRRRDIPATAAASKFGRWGTDAALFFVFVINRRD